MAKENRYSVDLNWVWGPENPNLEGVATLRAVVSNPEEGVVNRSINEWLETIIEGDAEARWEGGWVVTIKSRSVTAVELDLTSGGQDVAESLGAAVERLENAVLHNNTVIEWETQPISAT